MRRLGRLRPRVAQVLSLALAAGALAAAPASALNLTVDGEGSVAGQSSNETASSLLCTGNRATTVHCTRDYPATGSGCIYCAQRALQYPSVHLVATPAPGWTLAGYGDPPVDTGLNFADVASSAVVALAFVNPAPAVTLTVPDSVSGPVTMTAAATDDSSVLSTTIDVLGPDGAAVAHITKDGARASLAWDSGGVLPGRYIVKVTAVDLGGTSGLATRAVTVVAPGTVSTNGTSPDGTAQTLGANVAASSANFRYRWGSKTVGPKTTVTDLLIHSVSAGATLTISCTGTGCPPQLRLVKRKAGYVGTSLIGRTLRRGATVEVRASAFGQQSYVVRWQLHARRGPTISRWCTAVNSDRVSACS